MAAGKRYYWLKLKEDFFSSKRIKKLRRLAGGDTYTIIYLKLQLLAMKSEGVLSWTGLEQDFAAELALDIDEDVENIKVTMAFLLSCGLAESSDNINFLFPYAVENVGSEGSSAQRMRDSRAKLRIADQSQSVTLCAQSDGEKDIEKRGREDKDGEKDKDFSTSILQGENIKGGVGENGDAQPQDSCESAVIPEKEDNCGQCPPTVHTDVHGDVRTDFVDDFSARPRSQREIETDFNELRNQAIKKLVESGYR